MDVKVMWVEGTELYCQYRGQSSHQPCYVELDCDMRQLRACYDAEVGGVTPFTWQYHPPLRWAIPPLRGALANELLNGILPLAEIVLEGCESEWDGDRRVEIYSGDAENAIRGIGELCAEYFDRGGGCGVGDNPVLFSFFWGGCYLGGRSSSRYTARSIA